MSWTSIYNRMKVYLDEGRPDQWIVGTITNGREMKTTYQGAQSIIPMLKFLEMKAGEEQSLSSGDIIAEGEIFNSIAGGEG